MAMARAVSSSVSSKPRSTRPENRYCPTTSHWKRCSRLPPRSTVENASEWTIMAPSTSSTAPLDPPARVAERYRLQRLGVRRQTALTP